MSIKGAKVAIIGGSISGCATASALLRSGCDVDVFERSSQGLRDRGAGIFIPIPLRAELVAKGYLPTDYPFCETHVRWWLFPNGTRQGRRLWTQPSPAIANNWGDLWAALRSLLPDERYHDGKTLVDFDVTDNGVAVHLTDGTLQHFDLVVGADGYRSIVRQRLHPEAEPVYANYIFWRGSYPVAELGDTSFIEALDRDAAQFVVPFQGGHGLLYMIPEFGGDDDPGQKRVNWGVYGPRPEALALRGVASAPPGSVTAEVFAELQSLLNAHFPPATAELFRHSQREDILIQPIYDSVVTTYVGQRVLLVGDAGTLTRPHTASGATKALEDALAIEALAGNVENVPELLARYDRQRCHRAKTISEIGKRLGQEMVVDTPDWNAMTHADFEDWTKTMLAGETLYFYGSNL